MGEACQVLLLAACDNLKLGHRETLELRDLLSKQLGYRDLGWIFYEYFSWYEIMQPFLTVVHEGFCINCWD